MFLLRLQNQLDTHSKPVCLRNPSRASFNVLKTFGLLQILLFFSLRPQFDFDNVIKTVFLAADHRFCSIDEKLPFKVNDGDVPIFDMTGFSYRHLARLSLSTLRCYMKFTQEAFPVKLKKIHLINVSPVLNKVLLVLRPFMNSRVRNSMNFHLPNTTTMFDDVPQELLPNEYGGKAGPISEIKKNFIKQIEANRWDWPKAMTRTISRHFLSPGNISQAMIIGSRVSKIATRISVCQ